MFQANRPTRSSTPRGSNGASPRQRILCLAVGLALCDLVAMRPALAQSSAATATGSAAPAATAGTTATSTTATGTAPAAAKVVNVVGERPTNRIDRQVYDVKQDINASNGSAADALGNVPSVSVDADGNVSLRGSSNVQILVDGKPSAMLQGDNRGPGLQAMPADDIDSVEVINNPGAEFGNEGGGGPILNLVMKRNRKPGGFGFANANVGTAGRYNSSLNGSYNTGRWGFQGGVNVRHDGRDSTSESERERIDPVTGESQRSTTLSSSSNLNDSAGVRGQVSYNLTQDDTLEANIGLMRRTNDRSSLARYGVYDDGDSATSDYYRTTQQTGDNTSKMFGARWDHKGEKLGELFKMDLRVSDSDNTTDYDYANRYVVLPPYAADSRNLQHASTSTRIVDYTGDYERPLDNGAIVKMGWKAYDNKTDSDNRYYDIDLATGAQTVNGRRTNAFGYEERDTALYTSYQWRVNERWGALVGLRAEHTDMDIGAGSAGAAAASNSYLNWMPSAFATYKLDDKTNLRFSYARRIRRPQPGDLNPFVTYKDELNESSGNPFLKPVKTDSLEVGYETKAVGLDANVRAYYRNDSDMIRSRQYAVNDTVILTTLENGGSNRSGGLEFTLSGKVTPKLSINTSGNVFFASQQQIDITGAEYRRSATSVNARGRINYALTAQDSLQLMINAQGKTLAGTGYREPNVTADFNYKRNLTPALSLTLRVTDLFDSAKSETITDTALLKEHTISRANGRIFYVGLSYRFGGVQSRREGPEGEGWRRGPPPDGAGGPPPGGGGFGPGGGGPGM